MKIVTRGFLGSLIANPQLKFVNDKSEMADPIWWIENSKKWEIPVKLLTRGFLGPLIMNLPDYKSNMTDIKF